MIVACQRCRTRFQLDDARVPEGGVRVRCSRCKHAFFVLRPGASRDDVIRETASEAASQPLSAPGATHDLSVAVPDSDLSSATHQFGQRVAAQRGARAGAAPSPGQEGEESDWQFNDERPAPGASDDRSPSRRGRKAEAARGGRADPSPALEELGSPESWDFLAANEAREAEPESSTGEASATGEAAPADPRAPGQAARRPRPVSARALEVVRSPERAAAPLAWPIRLAGGALSALLLFALGALSFAPGSASRAELPSSQKVGELALDDLHVRLLENAVAGRLFLMSGRLRNPGAQVAELGGTLRITLLGEGGRELATAMGVAGLPLSEATVREERPERLQELLARSATALAFTPIPPGESVALTAIVSEVPLEARSFAVSLQPVQPPPPPPPAVVPAPEPAPAPAPPPAPSTGKARHPRR